VDSKTFIRELCFLNSRHVYVDTGQGETSVWMGLFYDMHSGKNIIRYGSADDKGTIPRRCARFLRTVGKLHPSTAVKNGF